MKDENKSLIVDARRTLSGSGKIQKDHNKHFNCDKVIPDHRSLMHFLHQDFFEGDDPRVLG